MSESDEEQKENEFAKKGAFSLSFPQALYQLNEFANPRECKRATTSKRLIIQFGYSCSKHTFDFEDVKLKPPRQIDLFWKSSFFPYLIPFCTTRTHSRSAEKTESSFTLFLCELLSLPCRNVTFFWLL